MTKITIGTGFNKALWHVHMGDRKVTHGDKVWCEEVKDILEAGVQAKQAAPLAQQQLDNVKQALANVTAHRENLVAQCVEAFDRLRYEMSQRHVAEENLAKTQKHLATVRMDLDAAKNGALLGSEQHAVAVSLVGGLLSEHTDKRTEERQLAEQQRKDRDQYRGERDNARARLDEALTLLQEETHKRRTAEEAQNECHNRLNAANNHEQTNVTKNEKELVKVVDALKRERDVSRARYDALMTMRDVLVSVRKSQDDTLVLVASLRKDVDVANARYAQLWSDHAEQAKEIRRILGAE